MRTGTNHFITYTHAREYYSNLGFCRSDVDAKIQKKEIEIGKPQIKIGETLKIDKDGRYWIEELPDYDPVEFID